MEGPAPGVIFRSRGHGGRIDAARQKDPHRSVARAVADRSRQHVAIARHDFSIITRARRLRRGHPPVPAQRPAAGRELHRQGMTFRYRVDGPIGCSRLRRHTPRRQERGEPGGVDLTRNGWVGENAGDHVADDNSAGGFAEVQQSDAEAVARTHERMTIRIPQRKCVLAVQVLRAIGSPPVECRRDDFEVRRVAIEVQPFDEGAPIFEQDLAGYRDMAQRMDDRARWIGRVKRRQQERAGPRAGQARPRTGHGFER